MADKVVSGVKLTNNRDANINAILNKAKNAQWAYNDLRVLIKDLESVPEPKRKSLYGIDNDDVQALKEIRLDVVNDIQKRDRKGIGPDLNYYGEDKATVAKLDREYTAARAKENKRLTRINTQTPIQKAAGMIGGFGEGISLNTRAAAYERAGLPGSMALNTVDPDDPWASSGLRAGHAYGQEYLSSAAGVPGTLLGGGAAAGAVRLASGFLPQTRFAQGALGLLQGGAAIYGGAKGGEFTSGLAQKFSPGARLSDETQTAIGQRTAGPERGLAQAAAQATLFTPFSRNAEGRMSLLEGQGVIKSAKNLFTGGPQKFNQGALETPIDIAGRAADAMSTNSESTTNNKKIEARLASRFGRPATREELIANGWMTPEEQQIQIGLSLGLGGFTKHGELFTGKHIFNVAQQGVNTIHDRVIDRSNRAASVSAATPTPTPGVPVSGLISRPNTDKYKFNITVPGLNQAPAEQSRVTFSPGVMSATVEPRVDRIPEQYKTSIAKELRDKVGQVNGVLITGVSADGDFFTQTQQMDGSTKIETKSYQELPDALRQRVRQAMLGVKIDGRAIDADATFDPSRGYTGEYNTNIDAHPVYKNQFPVKVEVDGKEVNAAVMEKVGNANVRLQLPSGNSIVVPSASVIGDATNVTGVRKSSPPRLSKIKDGQGNPIAYEDQGIDFFIPMGQGERKAAAETPGSWKEMFKFDRSEWEDVSNTDLQPGTVIKLENLGANKNIWGVVLRPEQFSFDGEDAYGWRVQPLHDPRAPQIIVEHTGVELVDPNNPDVIEAAVEAGALDPTMAESAGINADVESPAPDAQVQATEEEESGTPVELKPTAPSGEAGVSPAVVQTTTSGTGVDTESPQPSGRTGRTNASRAEAATSSAAPTETTGEGAKAEPQPTSTTEQPPQGQPEAPRATSESTTSTADETTTATEGRASTGRRRVGSRSVGTVQPEDFTFKYGEEFKQTIPDKDLPAEMRSDRRTDKNGQVNAYRRMTRGEESTRTGSDLAIIPFKGVYDNQPLTRLTSAFTLHVNTEKGQEAWDIQVKDATKNGKFGQSEFKQLLVDEWGQTDKQAEALSKYVDRWAVGWAKEIARLSGYNINTVARALRLDTDPTAPSNLEDWEAWKSNYREQQVLNVTEANKKLIAKLVGVFYAQRLGGIVGLTTEQRVSLGRPGATFTLQANGNKVMHVAMALKGKLNYVTQVHEVNHLLVRSLYGPMYHELAASIRQSFVISGNQEAKTRTITPDVEEQIVTSLTNAIFNSSGVGVIKERFTEGGAINDSTLTQMFNSIGQQMKESIVAGETEWHNDLATNPGWAMPFDGGRAYATDTPILYTIAADRNPVPGVLVSDYNPVTGDRTVAIKYEIDGKEKTERVEFGQLRIGQSSVTKLPDAAQRIVAKWMNHWHDWTVEQISDLVPEIKTERFTPITQQDLIRKNVGYHWWRNVDDYKQRARTTQEDASKFSNKRIRARSTYSYLGWLDNPQGQGYNSYIDIDEMMRMERGVLLVRTDGRIMIGGAKGEFELTPELAKLIEKEKAARAETEKQTQPEAPKAKVEDAKPDDQPEVPTPNTEAGINPNAQVTPSDRLNTARTMIDSTLPSITQAFKAGNFDKVNSLMKHALESVLRLQAYNKNDHPDHAASHRKFEALVDEVTSFIDGVKADVEAANASKEEITKISDKAADDFLEQLARQSSPDTTPVSQEDADIFGGGGWMSTLANKEDGQVESKGEEKKEWKEKTDEILKTGVKTLIDVPIVGRGKDKRTDINAWQNRVDSLIENVVTSPMTYVFANRRIREQAIFHDALTGVYISKDTTSKNTRMGDERFQLKSYIDIGVRTRLTSLMRTVSVKNNALYMNIQTEGYIHPVKITPDVIYAEIERAVSTATSQAIADYVKQELNAAGTAQDAVLRYMRKTNNSFDAAVELAVSTAAFGRWQRYKPENRKWVDIRTLTTNSIGESSLEKIKKAKSSNEIIKIIQDNPNDFYGTMFAHSVDGLLDPKNGAFRIRNNFEVPLLESTDAQYAFTRDSFKEQLERRAALSSLDSGDFVEPAAKAEGSMQKLMQKGEGDDVESLSDDEQSILNVAKSLLTSPDYFRDMVDSVIKYEESHTKPELTFENLQNRLDGFYQSVTAYKEDLAWERANDGDESVINGLINSINKQQNIIEQVEGIIANRRNRAAQQSRESMDSMEQVFDALSEMTDKELYSFFLPDSKEDRGRIDSLATTSSNGTTNFFSIHNGLAKNPFSEEAQEVLSKLASYADNKEESSLGDVDHYAVMATSIVNVKKMFERATEIYDRSRSIQTRGNLTPRYVKFLDALPVKDAVILDARRVNLQTYKIGSTSSLSDENLQSFIGVGSATYKDALYGSKEDKQFNDDLKQRLTKELGQVPSQSQLMAGGYKVSIIDQMNTAEMNALLGTNNKFIDELTLERHKGLFRQLFSYLKSTPGGQPKDATKTVEQILFKDPHTYTVGEKIWMVLNVVENTAGKDKVDSHVNALRTILRKGLEATEGGTNERLTTQAKNLRMFRRHVSDSMVMPLQRDYVGTRPGGLVEVTTTNSADAKKFAKAVFQHVLRADTTSILNKEVYDRQGSYSTLVKRINKAMSYSKAAKDAIGSPRTVLSDAELFAIAESYDVPGNEYTIEEKYAFVNAMIEKRDQSINKPLKTWLQDKQKVRAQLTIRDINEYLDQSQMSDVDKKAFISLYTNSLTADKSQLKRFVALTGRLPERQELPAVAKIIDVDIKKLQSEYESVEKLVASVGLDALSYNVVGTSIKITHYNRMIDSVSRHGIFVNIDPSYLQGQDAFARSTWVDLSNMLDMEFDRASPEDAKLTEGILASTLTDMVWSRYVGGSKTKDNLTPPRLVSSLMKAPNQRVKNVSNIRDMDERQKLATHIHNMSTGALKDVLTDVTRDGIALTDINTSLQKLGKTRFVESYNVPSKAMPDRENGFKEYSTEYARNVIAARKEMVRSVNDPTFDNYEYVVAKNSANKPDYSIVKVYDRVTGKNIYEIDYVNGRVFNISSGTRVRVMPVPVNEKGITALHVKLADVIFQGSTKEQRAAREDLVYQAMVNEPTLNPVPAVFWHGRYRILQPVDADVYEPMYMSTLRSDSKDVFNSVGSFDPTIEDAYIKPVLDTWTTPDITGNTRVRTDTSGLPFFDGYGYTVTTAEGHRSSVFANLIANGLSKEKALSIYAMTEHPIFKSWKAGDLVESVALRKATSFVDQGRVVDAETYNKVNKVIALNEFTKAVEDYMDNPSQENLDRVEFTYDETELGRHLTENQLKAKAKSIVKTQADALAYIKTANDMANSLMTEDIAFHVNPYKAHREGEKQVKTGQPFTTLVFEDGSNTFMNMDAPGLRTFDLGSGLSANGSRVNQPYFAKAHNPYVYDAVENGIQWDTMQGLIKKAMKAGHDGLVITNFRPNLLTSERKNILYTFNDSNIRPISEMGTPMYDTPIVISDEIVEPMFMNAPMYAPVTARTVPAASSAVFVEPPKSGKEIAGDVVGYAGDVVQGIARFPLSLDFAFVGIQGAKALLGGFLRPYDTRIALQSFMQSMRGMAPNTSITIGGKRIGFDKLGRRAWLQVYEEMRKDPYFQLMRDLNVPLHFVNFEKNVETKRRQIYQEAGGKIRYEDIKLDMLDFDERGNMTDYFERVTPTTWLPLTGMFERQMSLNHDLLLFNQIKYQLEHNSMFKGLTNEELVKRRDVKALVNFLAMSVGDVQYSTNDRYDAAAGRWGKFIAAAPRWYLSNILMNPIINPAVTALYKAVPKIREVLGENYRGVGLYDYNLVENKELLAYQLKTFVGTAAFTALMPALVELLGRMLGREDITGEPGIGKWRFGNWKFADSSGVWDFWNTALTTADKVVSGTYTPLPKPGDRKSTADWLQQVSNPTLYKVSPVITKLIQLVTGVDVIGRPVYETDKEWMRWYEGFFVPTMKQATGAELGTKPFVRSLFTTSLSPTSWTAMYKSYYEADWQTRGTQPRYANEVAIKQLLAAALGTRTDYDQHVPQAFQGKYRLMQKYKRLYDTGPSMMEIINDPNMHLAPRMLTGEDKF